MEQININQEGHKIKIDLHCHTEASNDCITPLLEIPQRCLDRGINIQAITDHDQIWGAQKLAQIVEEDPKYKDLTIIIGEEISTVDGEIIGLFLKERIEPGLTAEETVKKIKEQGGLVSLPHGFDPLKRHRLNPIAREKIATQIDIIESFNARVSQTKWNDAASLWAAERQVAQAAGSDSHTYEDIGVAWTEAPYRVIKTPEDLLASLKESTVQGIWTHPVIAFWYKCVYYIRKKLGIK